MTHIGEIKAAAEVAATEVLPAGIVRDILVEPAAGFDGDDQWRVTILVSDDKAFDMIADDDFLNVLLSVKRSVRETGDDRLTLVRYATQADLDDHGRPES